MRPGQGAQRVPSAGVLGSPLRAKAAMLAIIAFDSATRPGSLARVNRKFARVEQVKKFFLLDTQLTAEDEELTPTMKLKRKLVQQKYSPQIEAMYA